jgi:ribosomal protein S27AE
MQLELLDLFETPSPEMPPRSRLISRPPQGLETIYCEALISYLTRIAGAHVVRPNVLAKKIIVPLTKIRIEKSSFSFNNSDSRTINSYVNYAMEISQAIETLTLQKDLKQLTFIPWGDLLDPKGSRLLKDHVGICKECLDDMEKMESGIYYPLIWYVRDAKICSKHLRLLEETCPTCGKNQSFVAHHAMLGYCTHCGAWLGTPIELKNKLGTTSKLSISERDKFITAALEQMISNNSTAEEFASNKRFIQRLKLYCHALTNGNMKRFEIRLGFNKNVIVSWADDLRKPRIDMFLELCFRLQQMPIELLTAEIPKDLPDKIGPFEKVHAVCRRKLSDLQFVEMKNRLESILANIESPTQISVATQLGVNRRFLNHHFPELARAISDKHKKAVAIQTLEKRANRTIKAKAVTTKMLSENKPISRRQISAALEKEGLTLAEPEMRHAVRDVIEEHRNNTSLSHYGKIQ